ncbi:Membrane protein involved in the export of O-antigen and teichoic acid [Tranquillimonas rosea]|uniref:Membrane protein involved in the export of O-antigen and teichoic acid n=1 Tax=Tranquillimonas rosea TaxID=641238 RepID=A0A1H9X4B7_9RHOB|nr:oligosaccharide flippase family protein [Tranquillimonas rosea]SES40463.1 Membrane protein involved in the export of O-antigen and teichoic acid [Tranquillimonas rosea]
MVRRSLVAAFADKTVGLILSLVMMAAVSRLLTPAEVGLFMVASSLVLLIEAFRDFGVAAFLIREPELTPDLVRGAVTLIGVLSLTLGLCVYFGADLLAQVYGEPDLGALMRIAAFAFLFAPISNPLLALLRRDMQFGIVARISIAAVAVNTAVTIALAALGFGPFSLVWGAVAAAVVTAIGSAVARPEWWIFRPTVRHWRQIAPFGAWSSVVTLLGMLYDAMPRLIIARILGFTAVGLFSRAISLTQLPDRLLLSAVQPVVLPAFSVRVRERQSLTEPYLLGLSMISALQWPALLCLALLADPIVRVMLGQQWLEVVPLVRIVALAAFTLFPIYLAYPVLVALGRMREMALVSLIALPLSGGVILVAAQYGLTVLAWSMFLANALQIGVMLVIVHRRVEFAWGAFGALVLRSLAVALGAGLVPAVIVLVFGSVLSVPETVGAVLGAALGWYGALVLVAHPLAVEVTRAAEALGAWRARARAA